MAAMRLSLGISILISLILLACSSTRFGDPNIQLIRAAEKGETKEMFRLIRAGADINAIDKEGWTPYLAASTMGHLDAMRMLKAFGARTEAPDPEEVHTANQYLSGK